MAVVKRRNSGRNGITNVAMNLGLTLAGSAAPSFDLVTLASPCGNTFAGNDTGNQTSGINLSVAAGLTVNAVGNSFLANVQGANARSQH